MLWAISASPQPKSATTWEDGLQSKLSKNNKIIHSTLSSWTPHCDGHSPENSHLQYIATDWCSLHNRCFIISQARQMQHFVWSVRWGEKKKIKCLLPGPSFWLFHPSMPTKLILADGRDRCQKDQWKHDPLLENCHLSGNQKHRREHKPQEITTTRAWITFNNVRVSAVKLRFAQSNFSLCPNTAVRKSSGKTVVQTTIPSIIMRSWVVFCLSTLNFKNLKSGFFLTQLEAIQEHLSS